MDHHSKKSSPMRRTKRAAKVLEENFWDCSVCTYRNNAEAFKCLMCDVRKGTSTRKPRMNPQLVAQQVASSQFAPTAAAATSALLGGGVVAASATSKRERKEKRALLKKARRHPARLKNVDRSTAQTREVTVNSVTVVITEYKPKMKTGLGGVAAAGGSSLTATATTTTTTTTAVGAADGGGGGHSSSSSSESHSESSMDAR